MKRKLSLALSLLMLMSMVTIVGATDDSNIVWQEDFNDGVTIGTSNDREIPLGDDGIMKIWENDNNRQVNVATVTLPEGAYGKGSHEKSLFIRLAKFTGDHVRTFFEATFPNDLLIAEGKAGHIGFDWINFSTGDRGQRDEGRRDINLKVKFVNAEQEELEQYVYVGNLMSNIFKHANGDIARGEFASWNRLSIVVQGNTVYTSAFSGDTWRSVAMTCPEGYTPVAVTGLQVGIGFNRTSPALSHLYGLDNFIAEKVSAVPTVGSASSGEVHPVFVPFMELSSSSPVMRDRDGRTLAKSLALGFLSSHPVSGSLPANTTAAVHTRSFLEFASDYSNSNENSDHEVIIENAEGYFITDDATRGTVMGSSAYTMSDGMEFGAMTGLANGNQVHYGFKFKYTGAEHGADHFLMKLQATESGARYDVIKMKSDGTLVNAAGNVLTTLSADTYYKADVLYTIGNESNATIAEVYINGKLIDTVSLYKRETNRFQSMAINFYGEPKGEAQEVIFGDVATSAVEYYAHGLHIDDVYVNNVAKMGAFNKTAYVAYDLNKSLSEATDNIAKYGIVLDPGSMTASRVSEDWTAASFLEAIKLSNVSVVDADGTALTGDEALVGNKIKITGEFGAPVYYNVVSTGATVADTDFVLVANQNGSVLTSTCATGSAVTVTAVDNDYEAPQIFVAEYETINGNLKLVSCKGGVGSASLTPSTAGNAVKVFVVNTKDGLQPLFDANLNFTVQ